MSTAHIAQSNHYIKNGFGIVLRSSGIFYFRKAPDFKTTITFMNYWKTKRDLDVAVFASLRDMGGKLLRREELTWDQGHVINYSPELEEEEFEGSVEIEIFSLKNMAIPFAAIIVVYDTEKSVALTHNYARSYSQHEIEEGRTITDGEESCWTLRDSDDAQSFAVIHNGLDPQPAQKITFKATQDDGSSKEVSVDIPELSPFSTYKFIPQEHMPDLVGFLKNKPGNGALSFKLNKGFTRMLVGNERPDSGDLQITHSNFNYSRHKTDEVVRDNAKAWMVMPDGNIAGRRVRVYPDCDVGHYTMSNPDGTELEFDTGETIDRESDAGPITFSKAEGGLPSRLVTAIVGEPGNGNLPFELSLGILHANRPPKRMWWAPIPSDETRNGSIIATCYEGLYGEYSGQPVNVRLYSEFNHDVLSVDLDSDMVEKAKQGLDLEEIFPNASEHLGGGLGWFTWYSEYGGFQVFTKLMRKGGSYSMEHGF